MIRCKNCGLSFPSFVQINEVAFKTVAPVNNSEQCPGWNIVRKTIFSNNY